MLIGSKNLANGDIRRVIIDYRDWLLEGDWLSVVVASIGSTSVDNKGHFVNVPPASGLYASNVTLDQENKSVYLTVNAGNVNGNFTLQVEVTDTIGQVITDTLAFTVSNP